MRKKSPILIAFAILFMGFSFAQEHTCPSTLEDAYQLYANEPDKLNSFLEANEAFENLLADYKTEWNRDLDSIPASWQKIYQIPIVFHILYDETGSSNISLEQIESQMVSLNEDFRRMNPDAVNTPEPFVNSFEITKIEIENGWQSLRSGNKYIQLQEGTRDEHPIAYDFNVPLGDKLILYFFDSTEPGMEEDLPTLTPEFEESFTYVGIDMSNYATKQEFAAGLLDAINGSTLDFSAELSADSLQITVEGTRAGRVNNITQGIPAEQLFLYQYVLGGKIASDIRVEFTIANKDPEGNFHSGINRVYSPQAKLGLFAGSVEDQIGNENAAGRLYNAYRNRPKNVLQWDPERYLNVWVVDNIGDRAGGTILGFAQFPSQLDFSPQTDGIVVRSDYFGSVGDINPGTKGRTLSHEVGHWLNLIHIWGDDDGDDATDEELCSGSDNVDDTPDAGGRTPNNCPTFPYFTGVDCEGPNGTMFMNYMDYSTDFCMNLFTFGQGQRMRAAIEAFRAEIVSDENLESTGILMDEDALPPAPDFIVDRDFLFTGGEASFESEVRWADLSADYVWSFPGTNLPDVTGKNPDISFPEPGEYSVTLTVTNNDGTSGTITKEKILVVQDRDAVISGEISLDFISEEPLVRSVSANATGWEWVANQGSPKDLTLGSMRVRSWDKDPFKPNSLYFSTMDIDDLSGSVYLNFDYAYAKRQWNTEDRVRVMIRRGNGWRVLWDNSTDIAPENPIVDDEYQTLVTNTGNYVYTDFTPGTADWRTANVLITSTNKSDEFVLKIEHSGANGNYFYIDNININSFELNTIEGTEGLDLVIAPNPSKGEAIAHFATSLNGFAQVTISDVLGREMGSTKIETVSGRNQVAVQDVVSQINAGIYFLTIESNGFKTTKRFTITQ